MNGRNIALVPDEMMLPLVSTISTTNRIQNISLRSSDQEESAIQSKIIFVGIAGTRHHHVLCIIELANLSFIAASR